MNTTQGLRDGVVSAAELLSLGLALCRPDPGQKKPTYQRWGTYSLKADDFAPDALYGILGGPLSDCNQPGHALVIVDNDDAQAVEKADDFLPPTGMEDGREGKPRDHRYYLVPVATIPDWAVSKASQAAPAAKTAKGHPGPLKKQFRHAQTGKCVIDMIGTGGQVVCPSPGNQRCWVGGKPGVPAVVSFIELWDAVSRLAKACDCEVNQLSPVERARLYVAKMPAAISGQGGDKATFDVALALVRGFGLTIDQARPILQEYNRRCEPPWTDEKLEHKLKYAEKSRLKSGYLLNGEPQSTATSGSDGTASKEPAEPPAATDANPSQQGDIHTTDRGHAKRVVKRHGADLHYAHPWKSWLIWDGRRWAEDQTGEAVRRVKETQDWLYKWAAAKLKELNALPEDDPKKQALPAIRTILVDCLKWEDQRDINRCLESARSEPSIPVLPADLDRDPWLFNVVNGTIDLRTGQLREHRREDLISKLAPVKFDPKATCPLWERSLNRWMDGNANLTAYLQRLVGYCLTADVSEQCLWFFYGKGANGKTTFLTTNLAMLGDYGMQAVSDLLMVKRNESHPTERADLFGRRFVATIETEEGKRLAEALMKQITGGDSIRARKLFKDFFEFPPTHKIVLAANHKPVIQGTDHGVWRRIKLVPFVVTISEEAKDKHLPEKLKAEASGILNWAIQGCVAWQQNGLGEPDEVRQATADYQSEQDMVAKFLSECCIVQRDARVKVSALFEAYGRWSGDKFMTQPTFNERLRAKGFDSQRSKNGFFWHGLALGDCSSSGEPG
jgi:P4 family phage/plasmid primase-like protien